MTIHTHSAHAKIQANYGIVYNVQDYIAASNNDDGLGIKRCLTDVQWRVLNTNGPLTVTILFPSRGVGHYAIEEVMRPMGVPNAATHAFVRTLPDLNNECMINIIGLDEQQVDVSSVIGNTLSNAGFSNPFYSFLSNSPVANGIPASILMNSYITTHAAKLNMQCNNTPSTSSFLQYTNNAAMPVLKSQAQSTHHFFQLKGDYTGILCCPWEYSSNPAVQLYDMRINFMGLKLMGIDYVDPNPNSTASNTAIYDIQNPSVQHDQGFFAGIALQLSLFKGVQVDNIIIENMYGGGIQVTNTGWGCVPGQASAGVAYGNDFNQVIVEENVINNVWALLYKMPGTAYDDRGDGILFSGIKGGIVKKNIVYNDLSVTHQYGRIGIAATAEHNWNIEVSENMVHGYDRAIHSEDNPGGFTIVNNRLTGSETGIVFDNNLHYTGSFFCPEANPSTISGNYISNEGIVFHPKLEKIYPPGLIWSRQAHRTNEHLYTDIENNTLLLDRSLVFPYSDVNRLTQGVPAPEKWSSLTYSRMHIRSGIRGQDIQCNALLNTGEFTPVWEGLGFGFKEGGVMLYSYCPNELAAGINSSCATYVTAQTNLTACSAAQLLDGSNTTPLHFKENLLINPGYLSVLHHTSSLPNIEKNLIAGSAPPEIPIGSVTQAQFEQNLPVVNHCAQALLTSPWFGNTVVKNLDCATGVGEIQAPIIGVLPSPGYTWSIQPSATAGLVPGSGSTFSVTAAGTYTVTASGGGQSTSSTFRVFAPAQAHCQSCPPQGAQLVAQNDMWLYDQAQASDLIADNGNNPLISNRKFFITGQLTINTDLTLNHCTVWFGPGASVVLGPGSSFAVVNESVLQAACDWWEGIVAMNDAQQKLSIEQNCLVQQMETGILISNNAGIRVTNSTFKNNINGSIFFLDFDNTNPFTWIKSSVFTGDAVIKPFRGIFIQNCSHLNIGDANNTELGNLFKDMQNGVEIRGNGSIGSVIANNTNQIGLFNNTFKNIHVTSVPPTYNLIMQDIYGTAKGCAVHIDYNSAPTFNANTTVSYTGLNTSAEVRMENCDKGIISKNNNLTAEKLYLKDCNYGIMNYNLFTKEVTVKRNKIENAHIGTQVGGNYTNYTVQGNDIKLTEGILASNIGYGLMALTYPAIGIDIKQNNPPYNANEQFVVDDNTIRIPYYAGKGIANLGANASQEIKNNKIYFTVANGTPQPGAAYIDPGLYGVLNTNTNGIKLQNNLVDGQYSLALYNLTFSRGLYFETSKDMVITCNKARATKQGLYAWGDNETDDINIKFNKFRFNRNPLFTLDNGANQTGTFGDIGDGFNDNGNDWVYGMSLGQQGSWLQNGQFRVWRQSIVQDLHTIHTDAALLTQSQSGSLNSPSADYLVNNFVSPAVDPCPDPAFSNTTEPSNTIVWSNMDVAIADFLAQQQQAYIAYADVGEWWNLRNLYERLSYDSTLLNSSAILQSFYANYANSTIHELVAAGMGIQALFDFSGDSIALDALYTDALNQNYTATGTTDAELYEQSINEMMLRTARYGIDSLSEVQKTELAFIAHLCPFAAGPGVYKARTLYNLLDPMAQYYDRLTCVQNLGQNKNGNAGYYNIDSLYEFEGDSLGNHIRTLQSGQLQLASKIGGRNSTALHTIVLYPNPAQNQLFIESSKIGKATWVLNNMVGQEIMRKDISFNNKAVQINLPNIANGHYSYKIQFVDDVYTGNLQIKK